MKNIFKKTICCILAVSAFLVAAVGCNNGNNETIDEPQKKSNFQGLHDYTMTETDDYLVKDGKTEYVLVTETGAPGVELTAKEEFITLFRQATNITIPQQPAEGLTHDPNKKYICVGDNDLFASSGIELDKSVLTEESVRIITKDKTIYIVGGGLYGHLYAVYDFMQLTFGFEQYYVDAMEIETNVKTKKLYNYNVTDVPDIAKRSTNFGWFEQQTKNRLRMPLYNGNYMIPIHSKMYEDENGEWIADKSSPYSIVHNSNEYLPAEQYRSDHDEWFGNSGDVLCYTAHGDEEELELMLQECTKKIAASLIAYPRTLNPNMNSATLTVEDNSDACSCDACVDCEETYGTKAASIILFMNRLKDYVDQWMEAHKDTIYYRENFELAFFAYNSFSLAPAKWDSAKGEYVPNHPDVKLKDGVYVYLALMNMLEEEINIYHSKNDRGREQIEKWGALSDGLWLWTYSTNFYEYLYFHDMFAMYNSEGYRYFAQHNIKHYYQNSQSYQKGTSTAFHTLSVYLQGKLTWDSTLDTDVLIDKFMNAMFREAAPIMKELLFSMQLHNRQYKEATQYVNSIAYATNFPYNTLKKWMDMCDDALAAIDDYRTSDPELYSRLKNHIDAEWIFPAYATLQLRSTSLTSEALSALKMRFKETGLRLGMTQTKEIEATGTFTAYLNSL